MNRRDCISDLITRRPGRYRVLILSFMLFVPLLFHGRARAQRIIVHKVLSGEDLQGIARRYRISPGSIRKANGLRRSRLHVGQRLKIIRRGLSARRVKGRYRVRRGDSLWKIARRHGLTLSALKRMNWRLLRRRRYIRPGTFLWVRPSLHQEDPTKIGFFRLLSAPGYVIRDRDRSWGTLSTVVRIHEVLSAYARRYPRAPRLTVMDLSLKYGGRFPPHRSHQDGTDADISYPMKKDHGRLVRATPNGLDKGKTWWLLKEFIRSGDVKSVFVDYGLQATIYRYARAIGERKSMLARVFQYPHGRKALRGIIRHEPGHRSHIHIRFHLDSVERPRIFLGEFLNGQGSSAAHLPGIREIKEIPNRPNDRRDLKSVKFGVDRQSKIRF